MKTLIKDDIAYHNLSGYGCLSRNIIAQLSKYPDLGLTIQWSGNEHWKGLEKKNEEILLKVARHNADEPFDVALQIMPAAYLERTKGKNFAYTQNAISELKPEWVKRLKRMDLVIVPSRFDYAVFKKHLRVPVEVIYQACDTEIFKREHEPQEKPFIFLNIASFNFRKGQDILLKAFKLAFDGNPNVRLYLKTGRESNREKFVKLHKEIDVENIMLDEQVFNAEQMNQLYNQVHCVVNPSRGEGWNMPLTEAMACELPVIAAYSTGMKEYLTEANSYPIEPTPTKIKDYDRTWWSKGWLAGYSDISEGYLYEVSVDALAARMKEVYENYSQAREKGKQARKDIVEKFSWEETGKKLHDVITRYGKF